VKLGLCALPKGVGWRGVALVGIVAGIGFTMAIFIAGLALPSREHLGVAKLAVLVASALAGVVALLAGRFLLPARQDPDVAALSVDDVEASTRY
jgi:NhaA family Na+:H+ antiporter